MSLKTKIFATLSAAAITLGTASAFACDQTYCESPTELLGSLLSIPVECNQIASNYTNLVSSQIVWQPTGGLLTDILTQNTFNNLVNVNLGNIDVLHNTLSGVTVQDLVTGKTLNFNDFAIANGVDPKTIVSVLPVFVNGVNALVINECSSCK